MTDDTILEDQTNEEEVNTESTEEPVNLVELLKLEEIPVNIPIEYLFVYNKLLLLMVELGESMLRDCKTLCNTKNIPIVECYHMFKTAIAAKQLASGSATGSGLGRGTDDRNYYAKLSDVLLNYVKIQLNAISNNYRDTLSFTLPYDKYGLVNLFITTDDVDTEVVIQNLDNLTINQLKEYFSIIKTVIQGTVITDVAIGLENYGLTEAEVNSHRYWHVDDGYEFIPGTSTLHVNGVKYILDDDDYEEWTIVDGGKEKGIGIKLRTGYFDVGANADEIYIKAEIPTE